MIRKLTLAGIAGLFALAVAVPTQLSARPVVGQLSKVTAESSVDFVKGKKKKSKKSKAGKCGTYKYWSKKAKKCVDARDKK